MALKVEIDGVGEISTRGVTGVELNGVSALLTSSVVISYEIKTLLIASLNLLFSPPLVIPFLNPIALVRLPRGLPTTSCANNKLSKTLNVFPEKISLVEYEIGWVVEVLGRKA